MVSPHKPSLFISYLDRHLLEYYSLVLILRGTKNHALYLQNKIKKYKIHEAHALHYHWLNTLPHASLQNACGQTQ